MKYKNLEYTPGYLPLYGFEIRSDSEVPLNLTGYQFRFEAFDDAGTRIFLEGTPTNVDGHTVYFTITEQKGAVFQKGNYNYRLVIVNTLGQTRQVYKGFITVDNPAQQEPPPSTVLVAADISDFQEAAIAAVDDYVQGLLTDVATIDPNMPTGMVADDENFNNGVRIKILHDAMVALGGGNIALPAGNYYYKDMDWWHPSVSMHGKGRNATVLKLMAGAASSIKVLARTTAVDGTYAPNPEFRSFHLDGRKALQTVEIDGIVFLDPEDDPEADWEIYGEKGYASGRLLDMEVTSFTGIGIKTEAHRTRLFLSNVRALFNNKNGVSIAGNDPIVGDRCGFGNNGEHQLKFVGCSGAVLKGANVWGNPSTRSVNCLAVLFQNCNSANVVGNVFNETISIFGAGTQDDRGIVISSNTLKPHDELFSSDGVTVDGNDDLNCHIRVRGANNVIVESNAFDSAQTPGDVPIRFKYLLVAQDSAAVRLNVTVSQETDTKPWASTDLEPFKISPDSQVIYTMYETTRAIVRSNGTSAFGLAADEEADTNFDLTSKLFKSTRTAAFDGEIAFPTPNGSRYLTLDEGQTLNLLSISSYFVFTGPDITSATITLPVAPRDGRQVTFTFQKSITSLTIATGGSDVISINPFPRAVTTNTSFTFIYKATGALWSLVSSLPGSALTQAQITAGAVGVVGHTSTNDLVMGNQVVTIDAKVQSITYAALQLLPPGGGNVNRQFFVTDWNEGTYVKSNGTVWDPVSQPKAKHWIDPKIDHAANAAGTSTTSAMAAALAAAVTSAIGGVSYGRGKPVIPSPGVYKFGPQTLSGHVSVSSIGATGSVVFQMDHAGISASTSLFTLSEDGASTNLIISQSEFNNIAIDGLRLDAAATNHGQAIHGLSAATGTLNKSVPALNRVQFVRNSGDAVKFNNWHNYRSHQSRFINNGGWGLNMTASKEGQASQTVYGENLLGGVSLNTCERWTFDQCMFTAPGSAAYKGRWIVSIVDSFDVKFSASHIVGPVLIQGSNQNTGSSTRFSRRGISFCNTTFQVSEDVKAGYAANHSGDNEYIYDGQIEVKDCSGINMGDVAFRFGSAAPTTGELNARPDYFIKFTSAGAQDANTLALNRGSVQISSVDFVTREMRAGLVPVILPFKKRPFNYDDGVVWTGQAWDQPVLLKKDTVGKGWVLADGTTGLSVADYPLAYLAGNKTRTLDDGVTTFTVLECSNAVPDETYGWYLRAY